jgi:late competence protein required for DNA uptake (superfamily II DNA/RNA helicase)
MKTGIKFRVVEDNKNLGDTLPIIIPDTKRKIGNEDFILEEYQRLKDNFPNAEIIVICETTHWETYKPMTKLLIEDVYALIEKSNKSIKSEL